MELAMRDTVGVPELPIQLARQARTQAHTHARTYATTSTSTKRDGHSHCRHTPISTLKKDQDALNFVLDVCKNSVHNHQAEKPAPTWTHSC